jgi:hypothetical protein
MVPGVQMEMYRSLKNYLNLRINDCLILHDEKYLQVILGHLRVLPSI